MRKVNVLHDRILVEPILPETKTKGGIIIPETARERPKEGIVVSVGKGSPQSPTSVKELDRVFFGKHSGTPFEFDGKEYIIIRESDVLAYIEYTTSNEKTKRQK